MKSRTKIRPVNTILLLTYFALPFLGWYLGGIFHAVFGFAVAYIADSVCPRWYYDLTWKDIDLALYNVNKYGKNPCKLCFDVKGKKIFVYKSDENESKEKDIIPLSIRIPLEDWQDFFSYEDIKKLQSRFGGYGLDCKHPVRSYAMYPEKGLKDCKKILELFFDKAAGGLNPHILARTAVNSRKNIWKKHCEGDAPGRP